MNQVSKTVQEFYNESPFPDYELGRFNTKEDLKNNMWEFASIIDRSIPTNATIIDVGTGTGQLSAYLSLRRDKVVGIDFSDSSLKKARALKEKLNLDSLELKKVNILHGDAIKELGKFDYVLCLGVLHHTGNAYLGFQNICSLLKQDGKIAIGLYNKFGRIQLKIRIFLAKTIFKRNQKVKDHFIRMQIGEVIDKERAKGWWNDQYNHPYETTHTIGEVLRWFRKNNIKFLETVPSSEIGNIADLEVCGIFNKAFKPFFPISLIQQLKWIFTTQREGGYWITLGEVK